MLDSVIYHRLLGNAKGATILIYIGGKHQSSHMYAGNHRCRKFVNVMTSQFSILNFNSLWPDVVICRQVPRFHWLRPFKSMSHEPLSGTLISFKRQSANFEMHNTWLNSICYIFEVKLTFEMLIVRRQQHSFSTHGRVFLWKWQSFWDRKCLDLRGTRTPRYHIWLNSICHTCVHVFSAVFCYGHITLFSHVFLIFNSHTSG